MPALYTGESLTGGSYRRKKQQKEENEKTARAQNSKTGQTARTSYPRTTGEVLTFLSGKNTKASVPKNSALGNIWNNTVATQSSTVKNIKGAAFQRARAAADDQPIALSEYWNALTAHKAGQNAGKAATQEMKTKDPARYYAYRDIAVKKAAEASGRDPYDVLGDTMDRWKNNKGILLSPNEAKDEVASEYTGHLLNNGQAQKDLAALFPDIVPALYTGFSGARRKMENERFTGGGSKNAVWEKLANAEALWNSLMETLSAASADPSDKTTENESGRQSRAKSIFEPLYPSIPNIHDSTDFVLQDENGNDIIDKNKNEEKSERKGNMQSWIDKIPARIQLSIIARQQYPWLYAMDTSPATSNLVNFRIGTSIASVESNKSLINNAAETYGVPNEIIGGIIFKEQLTSKLPDAIANIDTYFDGHLIPGFEPTHSTGLGAIFPATARAAWKFVNSDMILPASDKVLQYKLTCDNEFNIRTIAAVLIYEAKKAGFISKASEAKNLTPEQWKEAVHLYNGGDEYAPKVYEYLSATKKLLE